jgi:hypothetical protein
MRNSGFSAVIVYKKLRDVAKGNNIETEFPMLSG